MSTGAYLSQFNVTLCWCCTHSCKWVVICSWIIICLLKRTVLVNYQALYLRQIPWDLNIQQEHICLVLSTDWLGKFESIGRSTNTLLVFLWYLWQWQKLRSTPVQMVCHSHVWDSTCFCYCFRIIWSISLIISN